MASAHCTDGDMNECESKLGIFSITSSPISSTDSQYEAGTISYGNYFPLSNANELLAFPQINRMYPSTSSSIQNCPPSPCRSSIPAPSHFPPISPIHLSCNFPEAIPPPRHIPMRSMCTIQELHPLRPMYPMCSLIFNHSWNVSPTSPLPGHGPIVMSNGTIQVRLRDGIRVDMTVDKTIRVFSQRNMTAIAISGTSLNSAIIHPNGRVLQRGNKIQMATYNVQQNKSYARYAKLWYKGISFTNQSSPLIYLVDSAGARTTSDTFTDLRRDYTLVILYSKTFHGPAFITDVSNIVQRSTYNRYESGLETYEINGYRISQAANGFVIITRPFTKCLIRISPGFGSMALTTPGLYCTASLGKSNHLFVKHNEKRVHSDGASFIVRHGRHSAGFNRNDLLFIN